MGVLKIGRQGPLTHYFDGDVQKMKHFAKEFFQEFPWDAGIIYKKEKIFSKVALLKTVLCVDN